MIDINEIAMLQLCTQVTFYDLYDDKKSEYEMANWCMTNNLSLVKHESLDLSDFSYAHDMLSTFWFTDEKDAILFKLKWS
jgi:hypothetical protein